MAPVGAAGPGCTSCHTLPCHAWLGVIDALVRRSAVLRRAGLGWAVNSLSRQPLEFPAQATKFALYHRPQTPEAQDGTEWIGGMLRC